MNLQGAPMTDKQEELVRLMVNHLLVTQTYPTYSEMSEMLGVTRNAVMGRMEGLERRGWLRRPGGGSCRYQITGLVLTAEMQGEPWIHESTPPEARREVGG